MNTFRRFTPFLVCLLMALFVVTGTAVAQKSQKADKAKPVMSSPSTVKELLQKYEGKATSLGTLKRVAGDFFVVEQEGVTSMYPLSVIHMLRIVKDEEANTETLEIHLVAKD